MAGVNLPYGFPYETVAAGQTAQVLGGNGATGDYLDKIVAIVATSATSTISIIDGSTSISLMAANTPIGTYVLPLGVLSATGPWKVTTGAGVSVIAVGRFSA